jgi:hypothetical protein
MANTPCESSCLNRFGQLGSSTSFPRVGFSKGRGFQRGGQRDGQFLVHHDSGPPHHHHTVLAGGGNDMPKKFPSMPPGLSWKAGNEMARSDERREAKVSDERDLSLTSIVGEVCNPSDKPMSGSVRRRESAG